MNLPVTLSVDADGIGWITFNDPTSRANVFNPAVFQALEAAIVGANAAGAKALVLISAKEKIFLAGADLKWLGGLPDAAAAAAVSKEGHRILQLLAESDIPVIGAIQGAAAGGGMEAALACHWRIASDTPATQIGLPESTLGTIPGWGGCVLLPRLLGLAAALEHIVQGRLLPAAEAKAAGLVDELVPADQLKARAKTLALKFAAQGVPQREIPPAVEATWWAETKVKTLAKLRGSRSAALAAIEVLERGDDLPVSGALAIEAEVFGRITAGAVCKNMIYAFFLRDGAKKRTLDSWDFPAGDEAVAGGQPVRKVGVVGAGVMGSGIAQWCAARGLQVVLRDVKPEFVERGLGVIRGIFAESVKRGKLAPEAAELAQDRIATTTAWEGFADCDLVVEAIVESVAAKQQLFAELATIVRPDTLLASNTSALPIEEIAGQVPNPGRTLGIHFFNPVSRMPLVELILGTHTTAATAATALQLVKGLGKSPVICRSSPGFLVTRVLFFYLNEACRMWERGASTEGIDQAMSEWGWPMGPMRLIDEVGVDVTDFIFGEMAHYYPERFERSRICTRLLAADLKGRKNGASAGFYCYEGRKETLNPVVASLAPAATESAPPAKAEEIARHLMGVMIAEAQRCLAEGVIKTPRDVDFALLSGAGFPAHRGGLMRYAESLGL
ncbi:MAG: enoyl-CoA hydratase/isomerase family protein [Cephaloticoccus sp.]|nr:enoyl-CoA hydratase/isomerase family protein [Cephaloticoccus sp.]